ncbi:MAG: hypothetical protein J6N76_03710 [Lachnospiraceae bacterium]|nr:hypothetical protein [Lachnospiraceae bacterium]
MKEFEESLIEDINKIDQPIMKNEEEENQQQNIPLQMNQEMSGYEVINKGNMIRDRQYEVGGKKESSRKDSKEMQAILNEVEALDSFLGAVTFSYSEPDSFLNTVDALVDRMKHMVEKCDIYLNTKNPWSAFGKARQRLVMDMAERLDKDIVSLRSKAEEFLKLPEEEKQRINSYEDFLNWERTERYVNGEDGVSIKHIGGNSSDVVAIEKGNEKKFFKKEDKLKSNNILRITEEIEDQLSKEAEGELSEESPGYYKLSFIDVFTRELLRDPGMHRPTVDAMFSVDSTGDGYADLKSFCETLRLSPFGDIRKLLKTIENMTEEEAERAKREIGEVFTNIKKDVVVSDVATNTGRIQTGESLAKRNVATSKLAKLLGIGNVVTNSQMASIEIDGKKTYGVVMDEAKGVEEAKLFDGTADETYKGKGAIYGDEAVRDLLNMQLFDAICGQTDRHERNRMLNLELRKQKGKAGSFFVVKNAVGIDSDVSFGNMSYSHIKNSNHAGLMKVEGKNGLSIPAISKEFADAILALSPEILNYEMLGLLNKDERKALIDRFKGVQDAIKKQMEYEKKNRNVSTKFIEKDKWKDFRIRLADAAQDNYEFKKYLNDNTYISSGLLLGKKID